MKKYSDLLISPFLLLTAILPETNFKGFQIVSELSLIVILLYFIALEKLSKDDIFLLSIFVFIQIGSFFINDVYTWMLNAKLIGLAVLSAIYFSKRTFYTLRIKILFFLCIFLVFLQRIIGYFPLPISKYLRTLADETEGRPLGLFLNYHYTTFFLGVFLIGYTYRRSLKGLDYIILFMTGVLTSFISYLGQKIFNFFNLNKKFKSLKSQVLLLIIFLLIFALIFNIILNLLVQFNISSESGLVVIYQMINPITYIRMLSFFPSDIFNYYEKNTYDYTGLGVGSFELHGNEMFLVNLFVQSGAILAIAYLYFLLKKAPGFRIFIMLTLLHYSYLLSPLNIYIIFLFSKNDIYGIKQ